MSEISYRLNPYQCRCDSKYGRCPCDRPVPYYDLAKAWESGFQENEPKKRVESLSCRTCGSTEFEIKGEIFHCLNEKCGLCWGDLRFQRKPNRTAGAIAGEIVELARAVLLGEELNLNSLEELMNEYDGIK